jgi:hypothetical protein
MWGVVGAGWYRYFFVHRKFGTHLATRAKRIAAKSIAAIPAESNPFIGVVAVLIADTGYELYAACETVMDLDQLYADLGMNETRRPFFGTHPAGA